MDKGQKELLKQVIFMEPIMGVKPYDTSDEPAVLGENLGGGPDGVVIVLGVSMKPCHSP